MVFSKQLLKYEQVIPVAIKQNHQASTSSSVCSVLFLVIVPFFQTYKSNNGAYTLKISMMQFHFLCDRTIAYLPQKSFFAVYV